MKQKKFILPENEIPTQWYNIQAEMPNKPQPMLNPKTGQPVTPEDIADLIWWLVNCPAHVNINRVEVMPLCQCPSGPSVRKGM